MRLTADGYVVPEKLASAAGQLGVETSTCPEDAVPAAQAIRLPRIVLFRGASIGYPYYAYYSHCLWSLGLAYRSADAADIVAGALDSADLLILPGGFATWGLDRAENAAGVDSAIRAFLAGGGACIGSCGGAFYLSQGRPGWLGVLDAKPRFSHEYLATGACLLDVRLVDPALRRDLPESVELAYYHGPVYPVSERASATLGVFDGHIMASRLFIDNPLDSARYRELLHGAGAILSGKGAGRRVVAFSAHPEMGEFVRKGMALDTYVRKYLPVRGAKVMDETLRFYAREDCLSYRLVLNGALMLGVFDGGGRAEGAGSKEGVRQGLEGKEAGHSITAVLERVDAAWRACAASVEARSGSEEPELAGMIRGELNRRREEWAALLADPAPGLDDDFTKELAFALDDSARALAEPDGRRIVETLVLMELPGRMLSACARVARCDRLIGGLA